LPDSAKKEKKPVLQNTAKSGKIRTTRAPRKSGSYGWVVRPKVAPDDGSDQQAFPG